MKKLRVYLVDDHAVVREGLKRIIERDPGIEIIGEAESGREAVSAVPRLRPNVVVMDISMPDMNGARAARALLQKNPGLAVLVLTVHEDRSYLRELMSAGASGYLLKQTAGEEVVLAIRTVAQGQFYIDPRIAGKMVDTFAPRARHALKPKKLLSEREEGVLRWIARGYSNKEIAGKLDVSVKTIETYKARSMEKLGLHSRVDVVRYAHDLGWLGGDRDYEIPQGDP